MIEMARIINISDRLNNEKSHIQVGDKTFEVNDSVPVFTKFEEMATGSTTSDLMKAIEIAIGKSACIELKINTMNIKNLKVLVIAILAAVLDIEYEEAETRFQSK
jgi:hypothetical protein